MLVIVSIKLGGSCLIVSLSCTMVTMTSSSKSGKAKRAQLEPLAISDVDKLKAKRTRLEPTVISGSDTDASSDGTDEVSKGSFQLDLSANSDTYDSSCASSSDESEGDIEVLVRQTDKGLFVSKMFLDAVTSSSSTTVLNAKWELLVGGYAVSVEDARAHITDG